MVTSEQCTTRKTSWQTDHKTPKHLLRSWCVVCLEVTTKCSIDVEFVQLAPKVRYLWNDQCCDLIRNYHVAKLKSGKELIWVKLVCITVAPISH